MNNNNNKSLLMVTDSAIDQIKKIISNSKKPTIGVRIYVTTKGCSGLSYAMEYIDKESNLDEEISIKGVKIFIDPKAVMFILGTEMDYKETSLESGFSFRNPNEKGRCGCGESFHV
jgi:iron-sulfur cluster assembly protein